MSSSDEFYDAESDTVEDLETPTVEANGCFIPVASDGDNGQVLPKPRLSKESGECRNRVLLGLQLSRNRGHDLVGP